MRIEHLDSAHSVAASASFAKRTDILGALEFAAFVVGHVEPPPPRNESKVDVAYDKGGHIFKVDNGGNGITKQVLLAVSNDPFGAEASPPTSFYGIASQFAKAQESN